MTMVNEQGSKKRPRDGDNAGRVNKTRKSATDFPDSDEPDYPSPAISDDIQTTQNNSSKSQTDFQTPSPKQQRNVSPQTPLSNLTFDGSRSQSLQSAGGSTEISDRGSPGSESVKLEIDAGEYYVKIERRRFTCSSDEDTKELAQNAGVLILQAQIIREIGEQLLANAKTRFSV